MTGRLIVDVSSLLRWAGPAVGIVRVQHALAQAALRRTDTVLACYDGQTASAPGCFRAIDPAWRDTLLGWSGVLDAHQRQPSRGLRRLLPGRYGIVAALERLRLTTRRPLLAHGADVAQRAVLALRQHRFALHDDAGRRIATVPRDLGLAEDLRPGAGDTVFSTGNDWFDRDPARIGELKARHGFRCVTLCYDIIPITHPHFYEPDIVRLMNGYWRGMLPVLDQVILNAACIADDLRTFCRQNDIPVPVLSRLSLGYDPPIARAAAAILPDDLRPGRYALFVSTIEPRKGHAMLLRVWRRLLARGVPQQAGFRLVFVGRHGWMVDDVMAQLADRPVLQHSVTHLAHAGDAALDALYAGAAFCLYPSAYEGFGLPVIESFARGKAVLASSAGATRETVGGLSPCLGPEEDAAWEDALEDWIVHPEAVREIEARVRAGFAHPDWPSAADRILDAAALHPTPVDG